MESKAVVYGLLFLAMLPLVSAVDCWEDHPTSAWDYGVGLCRNYVPLGRFYSSGGGGGVFYGYLNGRITATQPTDSSNVQRVILTAYTDSSPYPATLKCYKRMGSSGHYWWMPKATCTLYSGGETSSECPSWDAAGCPTTENGGPSSPPTDPRGPYIMIHWGGKNGGTTAISSARKLRVRTR